MGEVVAFDEVEGLCQRLRAAGKKIVTTNGCFDILHVGHVRILKKARNLGDCLIVAINSDASVRKLKGPERPINNQADRGEVLAALGCVDYVAVFDEDTPVALLELARPDIHVKGSDYRPDDLEETPVVRKHGGDVVIVDLVPDRSTTGIVDKIRSSSTGP